MKIHILSDLHCEFAPFEPCAVEADVIVLAGDIGLKTRGAEWALQAFSKPVIYVPGNHEYYGGSLGHTFNKLKARTQGTHVHVLNNEACVIDGVRFLGATLWTDYALTGNPPIAQWDAQQRLSDFKKIRDERFSRIRPYNISERHFVSRLFLQEALAEEFAGPTVVVTHHAPCELSLAEHYRREADHLNSAYASRMEHLMGPAALWVHGHTHNSSDYELNGTRVVCNPRGYLPSEPNPTFQPDLVIEV